MSFVARKISADSLALFRGDDAEPFATVTRIPPNTWSITTADAELAAKFAATPWTADVTPKGVCLAVRAMVELGPDDANYETPPWMRPRPKWLTSPAPRAPAPVEESKVGEIAFA